MQARLSKVALSNAMLVASPSTSSAAGRSEQSATADSICPALASRPTTRPLLPTARANSHEMTAAATEVKNHLPRFRRERIQHRYTALMTLVRLGDLALPQGHITAELHKPSPALRLTGASRAPHCSAADPTDVTSAPRVR